MEYLSFIEEAQRWNDLLVTTAGNEITAAVAPYTESVPALAAFQGNADETRDAMFGKQQTGPARTLPVSVQALGEARQRLQDHLPAALAGSVERLVVVALEQGLSLDCGARWDGEDAFYGAARHRARARWGSIRDALAARLGQTDWYSFASALPGKDAWTQLWRRLARRSFAAHLGNYVWLLAALGDRDVADWDRVRGLATEYEGLLQRFQAGNFPLGRFREANPAVERFVVLVA